MVSLKRKRTLQAFKKGDEKQLWNLTKELFETGFFNCYLSPQQFNLLQQLLHFDNNSDYERLLWSAFLEGSLILRFKEDAGDDSNSNENMYMKPGYSALRNLNATVRYLLYEKAVDYYFTNNNETIEAFQLLENNFEDIEDTKIDQKNINNFSSTQKNNDSEDDNYDDEDDDYDKEETDGVSEPIVNDTSFSITEKQKDLIRDELTKDYVFLVSKEDLLKKPKYPAVAKISTDEEAIGKMVHPILGTSSAIESSIEKQNELELIKNFNKTYHGFENDLPNILKKRKLERSDKQLEMSEDVTQQAGSDDSDSKQVDKLMSLGGAVNLSLKNLLQRIDANRDQLGVTDVELKNLIMDVRKNRSKWANYNKIGQEELYEACEKVVTELRGYTEHSTPFLNRVSKREAPNYYSIIKTPMDLNTVLKKLKTLQYQSKKQFVDDLMLIWQNCLTYNSDPKHFLRLDAIAMRKKTLSLIPLIADITIRDRAEVEREAAELVAKEKEKEKMETKTVGRISSRGGVSSKTTSRKGRKGANAESPIIIEGSVPAETPADESVFESKVATPGSVSIPIASQVADKVAADDLDTMTTPSRIGDDDNDNPNNGAKTITNSNINATPVMNGGEDEEDDDANMEDDNIIGDDSQMVIEDLNEDNDDLEISTWKTLTSNTRYRLCNERSKLFKDNQIQPNTEATIRTKSQMYNFSCYLEDESKIVLHRNRKYFDENDDPYLIEYDVAGGIPKIKHQNLDFDKIEENLLEDMIAKGKTLNDLPESNLKVKLQGSNTLVLENISLIQDIRKICFKINLIRTMQTSQFVHQSQFVAPNHPRIKFEDIDPMSKLRTRDQMTEKIASQALSKSVSALAMLNGFEQTTPSCAAVLTQIAEYYICNLAKTMKLYLESKSINKLPNKEKQPLSCREIIQIVLNYNGVEKPDVIYSYYKEKLTKQNKKLMDLKYGLENFLCDLLRPSMQELSESQFNDDSEQFVNGEFSDEIGDDFFGFKELGLDKEFGLLTSNIPLHLLQSKLSYQFSQMNKHMAKRVYEDFEEVKIPKLRKKDIPSQIGILQPFYEDLYFKSKMMYNKQLKKYQTQIQNGETPEEPFTELEDEEELILIEDDDLPQKQRNNRPKIPPNGKITQIKKKFIPTAFFIEKQEEIESRLENILRKSKERELKLKETDIGAMHSSNFSDDIVENDNTIPASRNVVDSTSALGANSPTGINGSLEVDAKTFEDGTKDAVGTDKDVIEAHVDEGKNHDNSESLTEDNILEANNDQNSKTHKKDGTTENADKNIEVKEHDEGNENEENQIDNNNVEAVEDESDKNIEANEDGEDGKDEEASEV
jgi:transcriptional activator SPT7